MTAVPRFVRVTVRLAVVAAAVAGAVRIRRLMGGGRAGGPRSAPIRTGSFDTWPTVPPAPGRPHPGS
jgi:hypothetical protein